MRRALLVCCAPASSTHTLTHTHTVGFVYAREHRHGEHKARFENTRNMTRFDNVMSCAHTARTRGEVPIPDAGAFNYIKWDVQSEVAGLSPALTKPNGSGNMDPLRLAVWWKVARQPRTCTDRDLMVIFCGAAGGHLLRRSCCRMRRGSRHHRPNRRP